MEKSPLHRIFGKQENLGMWIFKYLISVAAFDFLIYTYPKPHYVLLAPKLSHSVANHMGIEMP